TITKVATSDKKSDTIKQDPQKNSNADKTKAEKKPAAKVKKTPTENTKPQKLSGVSGLSKNLEVTLKLNDKKTSLKMTEDPKIKGRYLAPFTPDKEGYPTVHIYTKISKQDIEVTLHPEKIITAKSK
ncbi:MAG: hypothetical protein HZA84_03615, partial [Thaumarchaeota archaeon]|nr:hypothetical protein [Nitrososphaerota archaeon]